MIFKIVKFSITALLLLSLLITSTAHAYAPVATAVARALANKQIRNLVIGSGLLVGGGGTVLTDIFGGDYNPDTPAPPPADNGGSNAVWITNGLTGTRSMSPQGSCNLLNEGHGVKLTYDNGYRCTVYSPNLGGGSITYNTYQTVGDVWENPKLTDIANDIVNQAKNGNKTALDIIRASEPPAPFDIDNASNDELINWLKNNNSESNHSDTNSNPATSNSGTTGNGNQGGTGTTGNGNQDGTGIPNDLTNPIKRDDEKGFELPRFCDWAKVVCDYTEWVKGEYGKFKEIPETLKDEPIEIQDLENQIDWQSKAEKQYISFAGECPPGESFDFELAGFKKTFVLSYEPFCEYAKKIKPALIMGAYISALMIVVNGRTRE